LSEEFPKISDKIFDFCSFFSLHHHYMNFSLNSMYHFKKPALQRQEHQAEAPSTTGLMSEESVPVG